MARAPNPGTSGLKQSRKSRNRTVPDSYRHRPPVSGELSGYLRWRRLFDKRTAEENGTMLPAQVSGPSARPDPVQAPPWRPVDNPDAALLGLPVEIRLQIYTYLTDTTLIHVHSPRAHTYTWTPCKATNPMYPHLCLNPKWSGLCTESDRCTFKHAAPPEARGFWALRATCKLIRRETQDIVTKNGTFSIHPSDIRGWLQFLQKRVPKQLELITKITLAGPDHYVLCPGYGVGALQDWTLPNLVAVGLQCQTPRSWWITGGEGQKVNMVRRWEHWDAVNVMQSFGSAITIVIEGTIWMKKRNYFDMESGKQVKVKEQQAITRVVRMGKGDGYEGEGWENEDVRLEVVQPRELVEKERSAEWRIWWKRKELKYFG